MVLRLYNKTVFYISAVNRIFVPGKEMHKLFRSATKQQNDRQPNRKNNMCNAL